MPIISEWFSRSIYAEKEILTKEENDILINHSLQQYKHNKTWNPVGWASDVKTTWSTCWIDEDPIYKKLLNTIRQHVHNYAQLMTCNEEYYSSGAWLNFYNEGEGQELHTHNGETFSAVYFMQAPDNCSPLRFQDPFNDLNPLKNPQNVHSKFINRVFTVPPEERGLVIFRSYMPHMVVNNKSLDKDRITIAVNFK
jgi:uncharacterized protein (TIGR02466 family)